MNLATFWDDLLEGWRAHAMRKVIAWAGIAIGSGVLTAALAISTGLRGEMRRVASELGLHVFGFTLRPRTQSPLAVPLRRVHVAGLASNLPTCRVTAFRVLDVTRVAEWPGLQLVAADEEMFHVRPWRITAGRGLDPEDLRSAAPVAVMTEAAAFERHIQVGDTVRVGTTLFRIVGLATLGTTGLPLPETGTATGAGAPTLVVPWTSVLPAVPDSVAMPDTVEWVFVRAPDPAYYDRAVRWVRSYLHSWESEAEIVWLLSDELARGVRRLQRLVAAGGATAAALCLVLAGTALGGVLLAEVRERVPEIGLRRAFGASHADIGWLFLSEALAVSSAGSLMGMGLTLLAMTLWGKAFPLPVRVTGLVVGLPIGVSLAVAALFSCGPARRAARLLPAEALRES